VIIAEARALASIPTEPYFRGAAPSSLRWIYDL